MAGDPHLAREEDEDERYMGLPFGVSLLCYAAHHLTRIPSGRAPNRKIISSVAQGRTPWVYTP